MGRLKFIHAADLHLDSPLRGLEQYESAPVDAIRGASRAALRRLVDLAIEEKVAFVVIAGDVYDGDSPDFNTPLFFVTEMTRLAEAGIPVVLISGNHDAANRMTRDLRLPPGVRRLAPDRCETELLEDHGVAIHGQGFATAAVTTDLSAEYCAPVGGYFNLGLLHTCATIEDGHARYAPCTLDGLRRKQYDYWALGHIHRRQALQPEGEPPIVFPGNLQGRHIRETGPKGCMLVTVDDRNNAQPEFRPLDVMRWERCTVDAQNADDPYAVLDRFSEAVGKLLTAREQRMLAVRVEVVGACKAHEKLAAEPERWTGELRSIAREVGGGDLWVEKINLRSRPPSADLDAALDGPLGDLVQYVRNLQDTDQPAVSWREELAELKGRLPPETRERDGDEPFVLDNPAWMRKTLDQVRHLLVDRLLAAREGR